MSVRAALRRLVAALVVLSLLPGMPDLIEIGEHLVHDGHLPHSGLDEATQSVEQHQVGLNAERGCTSMSHHCVCHGSAPAVLPAALDLVEPRLVQVPEVSPSGATPLLLTRANAPPTPPPIA